MILQRQAVVIPQFGKFPDLLQDENFSSFKIMPCTPFIDPFLRPEEQHGCSGEDEVVVPAGEGQGEVNQQIA